MKRTGMKGTGLRVLIFCWLVAVVAPAASASQFVLVLHNAAGWQFQAAEKLMIDGKPKVRIGAAVPTDVSQDAIKRLPEAILGSAALRLHRGGYMVTRNGAAWTSVYPEASFKGSSSAQALWVGAQVVIQADRGSKDQAMRTSDIFAILPGSATPTEAAVAFLGDEGNFRADRGALTRSRFDPEFAPDHFHSLPRAKQSQAFVPLGKQHALQFKGFSIVMNFQPDGAFDLGNADFCVAGAGMFIDIGQG